MSGKTVEILERLKSLTMLETAELVKQIEETFGVDASPPAGRFYPEGDERYRWIDYDLPDPSGFDVVLEEVPADKKIAIFKVVRDLTGLGLK